jgi:alkylation response protein AidB-like acyl-CoA dehydrogenase
MTFSPAIAEQQFVLEHVAGLHDLASSERFSAATDDIVSAVLQGVGAFATSEWAPLAARGDSIGAKWQPDGVVMPDGYSAAYRAYVEQGWATIGLPCEWGGQGLPAVLAGAAFETLGTADMAFALCPMLTGGAFEALLHHGSAEQKALYLPRLADGSWTGTMNLTEAQAGSDVGALTTMATPCGDGTWSIKGTKIFISFGDHDLTENIVHFVLARTPDAPPGAKGVSLFLVPKFRLDPNGNPGRLNDVRVVSIEKKMGLHASPTCVLAFGDEDDCIGELVGARHGGLRAMFTMMNSARLNVGLQGVQVAEAAMQKAVAYARERIQGRRDDQPAAIIAHPDVRRMLMRMSAQTQAARALVYYAIAQIDRAGLGDAAASARLELLTPLAKAHATDVGCEVSSLGIQVHGGMGYIEEGGASRFYRDARITPIYEGTNGIQAADLVTRKLTKDGGAPFMALVGDLQGARHPQLAALVAACEKAGSRLSDASMDDRLAASSPFLTMLAVSVCGWLMERQMLAASDDAFGSEKKASARFYLDQLVPEALGLAAAAEAPATGLYMADVLAFGA